MVFPWFSIVFPWFLMVLLVFPWFLMVLLVFDGTFHYSSMGRRTIFLVTRQCSADFFSQGPREVGTSGALWSFFTAFEEVFIIYK